MDKFDKDFYDKEYFFGSSKSGYGDYNENISPFAMRAEVLNKAFAPKTSLEFGCAAGYLVEQMRKLGIDARGVDISEFITTNKPDYITCEDISTMEVPSVDLLYSFDVMEHLNDSQLESIITNSIESGPNYICHDIAVSFEEYGDVTSIPGMDKSHISIHTPSWWVNKFMSTNNYNKYYIFMLSPKEYVEFEYKYFGSMLLICIKNELMAPDIKLGVLQKLL